MPKKKPENELSDKEQFRRFKKVAREHDIDESGEVLDEAFKKIARSAKPKIKAS